MTLTPSQTMSQLVFTPVSAVFAFGLKTPYPFGIERTDYLVSDMDLAVKSAVEHGADVVVGTFCDPVGRDAIIAWPRDVHMQLASRLWIVGLVLEFLLGAPRIAAADEPETASKPPARPEIEFNRWQEDWSVLADPAVPREPLDSLKYIRLSADDPHTYLSLGANARARFESNDAVNFGTGTNRKDDYVLSRVEVHTDLGIASQIQVFAQLQSAYAFDKSVVTPPDQNRLDLEQAFIGITEPLDGGILTMRVGRQQIGFDLQRFVSVRDGPNVRLSYDAAWVGYDKGPWQVTSFFSHPVETRDVSPFDDYSSRALTYGGIRIRRQVLDGGYLSATLSRFTQDNVTFPNASGNERRNIADVHFAGARAPLDWDIEGMWQWGMLGERDVRAWAFGSLLGYIFSPIKWTPRLGIQIDAASGDKGRRDHAFGTFNPLFPNGYYVTLSGYTGIVNFIHIKPSLTVKPTPALKIMLAVAAQWRETTGDAVYTQPLDAVPGTAGLSGAYTGTYGQLRADWDATPQIALALEAVHFAAGSAIHAAGGHDSNYVGVEFKFGW